jgi:microcompartment protein CcmK/EutM
MAKRQRARKAIGAGLDTVVLAAGETAAREQHRTLSNLIELAVIRFLQAEGYLPK